MPITYVLGVGPGLGSALCRRFARGGHDIVAMARSASSLESVVAEVSASGRKVLPVEVDATSEASVVAGFDRARDKLGPADVLIYNAGAFQMGGLMDISPADFENCFRASCMGAFLAAQRVVPAMLARKQGTLLFTGATASLRGGARFACLAVPKFGLRALSQSLARELQPQGIHVAHIVLDGQIDGPLARMMMPDRDPATLLQPDAIAETYWQVQAQPPTTWSLEIDLRPMTEKF